MNKECGSERDITILYYCVVALFLSAFFMYILVCVQLEKIEQLISHFCLPNVDDNKKKKDDLYVPLTII